MRFANIDVKTLFDRFGCKGKALWQPKGRTILKNVLAVTINNAVGTNCF